MNYEVIYKLEGKKYSYYAGDLPMAQHWVEFMIDRHYEDFVLIEIKKL